MSGMNTKYVKAAHEAILQTALPTLEGQNEATKKWICVLTLNVMMESLNDPNEILRTLNNFQKNKENPKHYTSTNIIKLFE